MHSSRMRTARLLTYRGGVCIQGSLHPGKGVCPEGGLSRGVCIASKGVCPGGSAWGVCIQGGSASREGGLPKGRGSALGVCIQEGSAQPLRSAYRGVAQTPLPL